MADKGDVASLNQSNNLKGGFRASSFIFSLTALDTMGFVSNMVSLVLYFGYVMFFDLPTAANTLTTFMGSNFLLSLIGGFISDTYLTRFTTCLLFGTVEVVALAMVTVQAYSHDLQPKPCGKSSCVKGGVAVMFYTSLSLLALGYGGVRGALAAFGADQFDKKDHSQAKALATFFNWLILSSTLGSAIGVTAIVWVSTKISWFWGFLIATMASFVGFLVFALGKPFYRIQAPGETSAILRAAQVIVVAIRNRKLPVPENSEDLYEIRDNEDASYEKIAHSNRMRFLDKAAIVRKDCDPQAAVCSVTQVEEVKILTRMLPIFASTIIMNTCLAQLQTFSVQQGALMNRKLGSLEVPAPSIPVIPLIFMSILIPIYELLFVPFARKITGHPSGITQLQRIGVGLVLSVISMTVAGMVEVKRRHQALRDPTKPISLFWLSFQYGIFGIADMFTLIGLLEFFYREAPSGMKSLSTSLTYLSLSLGYFLSTVFVNAINSVTERVTPTRRGWLHGSDMNSNNLNLFYWFLAVVSSLNFLNYLYWAFRYKYKAEELSPRLTSVGLTMTQNPFYQHENETGRTNGPRNLVSNCHKH